MNKLISRSGNHSGKQSGEQPDQRSDRTTRPVWHLDLAVVVSGACLIAVLVGRFLAWSAGQASSVPLLIALLAVALVALVFGQQAAEVTQERGGLHRFLGRLCQRAALIQTAVGVLTLAWALLT